MCRQAFKWKKVAFLVCQVEFYRIAIYLIFILTGYEIFSPKEFYKAVMDVPLGLFNGFTGSFIALYCLIPFMNSLIYALKKNEFQKLLLTMFVILCAIPTVCLNWRFEYLVWYFFIYLVGGYIRIYSIGFLEGCGKRAAILAWASLILSWASIVAVYLLEVMLKRSLPHYWFVADSNKMLAFLPAVLIFYAFKNWDMRSNKFINIIGASTFGVLLIHASSDTMRKWLWQDFCQNEQWFSSRWFIGHAVLCVTAVFSVCVIVDVLRKQICILGTRVIYWRKK